MTDTVLTSVYRDWDVAIHCSRANAGFYRSVALVRAPTPFQNGAQARQGARSTLLETPGNFYPSVTLSNQAALASALRFIEHAEAGGHVH